MNARLLSRALRAGRPTAAALGRYNSAIASTTAQSSRRFHSASHSQVSSISIASVYPAALAAAFASTAAATAYTYADAGVAPYASSVLDEDPARLSVLSATEKSTGVRFPLSLDDAGTLHGTGVRLMGGLVQVYALGLYVDRSAARAALADWMGFSRADILSSDALWNAVCDAQAPFRRTFRFVVVREVGGKHMRNGFDRGLTPRVAKAAKKGKCKPAECKKATKKFADMFLGVGTMKVGSEVRVVLEGGKVSLTIDGRTLGEVDNPQLAWAMADMFLGENAVAPTLRVSTAEAFEELLKE